MMHGTRNVKLMTYNIDSSEVESSVPVADLFLKIEVYRPYLAKKCSKVSVAAIKVSEYYQE